MEQLAIVPWPWHMDGSAKAYRHSITVALIQLVLVLLLLSALPWICLRQSL